MAREINVFSDQANALVKKKAHEELGRQATLEKVNGLAIYDHREAGEPVNLLLSDETVYVVTANWN